MNKQDVLEKIFRVIQYGTEQSTMTTVGAPVFAPMQSMQAEANNAAETWIKEGDRAPITGLVYTLQTIGVLSRAEADELVDMINSVKT